MPPGEMMAVNIVGHLMIALNRLTTFSVEDIFSAALWWYSFTLVQRASDPFSECRASKTTCFTSHRDNWDLVGSSGMKGMCHWSFTVTTSAWMAQTALISPPVSSWGREEERGVTCWIIHKQLTLCKGPTTVLGLSVTFFFAKMGIGTTDKRDHPKLPARVTTVPIQWFREPFFHSIRPCST